MCKIKEAHTGCVRLKYTGWVRLVKSGALLKEYFEFIFERECRLGLTLKKKYCPFYHNKHIW